MSQKQEIEISISPTGEVELKVLGANGSSCLAMTKAIEDALGVVVAREKTAEYYSEGVLNLEEVKWGGKANGQRE